MKKLFKSCLSIYQVWWRVKYLRQASDQIGKEKGTFQDQEAKINCSSLWTHSLIIFVSKPNSILKTLQW